MRLTATIQGTLAAISLIAFVLTAASNTAMAQAVIDITKGQVKPVPIAVTDLIGATPDDAAVGTNISRVVAADLERSGLFAPIDKRAFIQTPESLQAQPRFGDWRVINAQALVSGNAARQPDGRLKVEFRLWDVLK